MDDFLSNKIYNCPILDEYTLNEGVYVFKKILKKEEYFLSEHRINHKAILPAAAYIEMIFAASKFLLNDAHTPLSLTNLMWLRHIDGETNHKNILLNIYQGVNNSYRIEVKTHTKASHESSITHMLAKMPRQLSFPITNIEVNKSLMEHSFSEKIEKKEIYNDLRNNGFFYGDKFQVLEFVKINASELLSEIHLANLIDRDAFVIHPLLLDGAIQTAIFLLKKKLKNNLLYLPFSLARISLIKEMNTQDHLLIYTKLFEETIDKDTPKFDIHILSKSGEILVSLSGFILKKFVNSDQA